MSLISNSNSNSTIPYKTVKHDKLELNPYQFILSTDSMIAKRDKDLFKHEHDLQMIQNDLIRSELNTYAKLEQNHDNLVIIQDIVDQLPHLPNIEQQKLTVPEFEEIEVLKTDTVEIKKFIRKMNLEFIGYYCNHKVSDEKCDMVFKNATDIYNSKEFIEYKKFLERLSRIVWSIRYEDDTGSVWDEPVLPLSSEVKRIIECLVILAGNISKFNARMNPECSRCKAEVRKYEYVLREVQRMRDDEHEAKQRREEIANNQVVQKPLTIPEFIREKFDGIDRFKVSEVKESYKKLYNITKTITDINKDIEQMDDYKVSNVSRTFWCSRK